MSEQKQQVMAVAQQGGREDVGLMNDAILSADWRYRYVLVRNWWLGRGPVVNIVGLNPAKADAVGALGYQGERRPKVG